MTVAVDTPRGDQPADGGRHRRARGHRGGKLVPLLPVLAGLLVVLYPVVATVVANVQQSDQAYAYTERINDRTTVEERQAALESAHRWNAEHQGAPILDPWLARITDDNEDYRAYLEELSLDEVMGRVIIPSIQSDLPIYHGTREDTLQKGIGHLYGSSLPVGGEATHAVLTGHTGLSASTLWDNLTDVHEGDSFYLDVTGQRMKYQIDDIRVVLPEETESLVPEAGKDQVTLITCTPYGINSHRLLLTGQRVPLDPEDEGVFTQTHRPWQWWMTAVLVVVVAVLAFIAYRAWRARRKRAAGAERNSAEEETPHEN
ncbi:class C sortase [Corynebacterium frankenforstense]|uniref:class C sortase n=1 Tax=Corynebacterium frankenforstense TaxID=1230998 RepID=UPI0039EE1978